MSDSYHRPPFPFALLRFWIWRILPGWILIGGMVFAMQIAVCATVHDNERLKALLSLMDALPPFLKGMLMLQTGDVTALIAIGYQHPLVLILFMIAAVGTPTALLTGEIQSGTMELILSRPATKTQVYTCAALPVIVGVFVLTLVMFSGTVVATQIYDLGKPIPLMSFFRTAVNAGLMASAVGGIALLAAAAFRRRATAVGLTIAYLIFTQFVFEFSSWWPAMKPFRRFSLLAYVNGARIFRDQAWPVHDMAILGAVLLVAVIAGGIVWHKRDLPL